MNVVEGWDYEPMTFSFQSLGYKRGPFTYRPDFGVRFKSTIRAREKKILDAIFAEVHSGRSVFWEVKGQETGNDRSKWRRFRKHTEYPLEIIKRDKMLIIQETFGPIIPTWESKVY